jgi:cellobiose phosphorylase
VLHQPKPFDSDKTYITRNANNGNSANLRAYPKNAFKKEHAQAFVVVCMWEVSCLTEIGKTGSIWQTLTCVTPILVEASRVYV